ncbi:MAG TPA: alpha/beta hydrolase [Bauldia sp.]|nr:alpha/beta hydrolase [Bauldia sp.]
MRLATALLILCALVSASDAASRKAADAKKTTDPKKITFAPFKDELFQYPKVLSETPDGSRVVIDFSRQRDVDGRDSHPETQADADRVSLDVDKKQSDLKLSDAGVEVSFVSVGDFTKPAKFAFIFVHGANGDRYQGVSDETFGGNFNRLKNLVVNAGGIYLSPGMRNQTSIGTAQAKLLITEFEKRSPGAPVYVACASNGGKICARLLEDASIAPVLGGVVLLGSTSATSIARNGEAVARRVPIVVAHGTGDYIVSWFGASRLYKELRAKDPAYPVRLLLFQTGKHGTPMRMIDWRAELNWMLAAKGK